MLILHNGSINQSILLMNESNSDFLIFTKKANFGYPKIFVVEPKFIFLSF